jgi:hypothetical protein
MLDGNGDQSGIARIIKNPEMKKKGAELVTTSEN